MRYNRIKALKPLDELIIGHTTMKPLTLIELSDLTGQAVNAVWPSILKMLKIGYMRVNIAEGKHRSNDTYEPTTHPY